MFIYGYPLKDKKILISPKERIKRFKRFLRQAHLDVVQVLRPVPLVGTDLRQRLEKEGRVYPQELVPWDKYDGSFVCFRPDNMTVQELQEIPEGLMNWFYDPLSLLRMILRTVAFPIDYLVRGWGRWHRGWYKEIIKYGGHRLIQGWQKRQNTKLFVKKLEESLD